MHIVDVYNFIDYSIKKHIFLAPRVVIPLAISPLKSLKNESIIFVFGSVINLLASKLSIEKIGESLSELKLDRDSFTRLS